MNRVVHPSITKYNPQKSRSERTEVVKENLFIDC